MISAYNRADQMKEYLLSLKKYFQSIFTRKNVFKTGSRQILNWINWMTKIALHMKTGTYIPFYCYIVKLLAKSKLILAKSKLKSLPYNRTAHPPTHPPLTLNQVYTSPTSTYEVSLESYTQGLFI